MRNGILSNINKYSGFTYYEIEQYKHKKTNLMQLLSIKNVWIELSYPDTKDWYKYLN